VERAPAAQSPKNAQTPGAPIKSEGRTEPGRNEQQRPQPAERKSAPPQAPAVKETTPNTHLPAQKPLPSQAQPVPNPSTGNSSNQPSAQQPPMTSGPAAQQPQQPPPAKSGQNPPKPAPVERSAEPQKGASPPAQPATVQRAAPTANSAAVPPPTQTLSKQQFLTPKGQAPTANIGQLRQERHEVREGDRVFIREPDRTIIQQGNRTIIRHNEVDRFAVEAHNVHVDRRGNETTTIVERPDGVRIVNITDDQGYLIRRVRRDKEGREVVIIDNGFAGPRRDEVFIDIAPPSISIPREHYIVEAADAREPALYEIFIAPPVEHIGRRYTVDQVRYNGPLRAYMPRVDLDINFDTGSWQLTSDQVDRLSLIAQALNRAIRRNPQEVFLIEGHTDAVGSDVDNLSLSDRRAESVAVALTEQFQVPPENLVTQGYGKQDLKIQTNESERANRRVAIRRITPLIDSQAAAPR
jgi:outer membrane protein OmpA-like peptidoglycan-associated protein